MDQFEWEKRSASRRKTSDTGDNLVLACRRRTEAWLGLVPRRVLGRKATTKLAQAA